MTSKFAATDINNHTSQLTVTEGTDPIVKLVMIDADGPAGIFIGRLGPCRLVTNQQPKWASTSETSAVTFCLSP